MRVHVSVTQEDIDRGVQQSCLHCPIAIALERVMKEVVVVSSRQAIRRDGKEEVFAPLPQEARDFIYAYDGVYGSNYQNIKPIEFDLEFFP